MVVRSSIRFLVLALTFAVTACGPATRADDDDDDDDDDVADAPSDGTSNPSDGSPEIDALDTDAVTAYPDAPPFDGNPQCTDWMCQTPIPDGCMVGTSDVCNDGLDNNCNGQVDEGCNCNAGAVQQCFVGPPGHRNRGACVDGMQTCQEGGEFDSWGPCNGGIRPNPEACDSVDNDCNGCADDHPDCCVVELSCPSSMPDGDPFVPYTINGTMFFAGAVTSWAWTVTGGPCDQLLAATAGAPTFTVTGANTSTMTFTPKLSGDYTVTVTITAQDGTVYMCTFIVHIRGPGLRVEMCSDRTSSTDIDLHLHRPNTDASGWFNFSSADTCFYGNCKATPFGTVPNWGYANSPLSECQGGPEGAQWVALGYCRNPRLDIDSINANGVPENINVDIPANGQTYRVMANFYGNTGGGAAHPLINIYCGGYLKATYGQAPDQVQGFDQSGANSSGDMWRVVDVTPVVTAGVTTDCTLNALHPPGQTSGYWVGTTPRTY
jgi:hypothetical protein